MDSLKTLEETFLSIENNRGHTRSLSEVSIVGFYLQLHHYLKRWPVSFGNKIHDWEVQNQRDCARRQIQESKWKFDATEADFVHYEQELLEENEELRELVSSLRNQIQLLSDTEVSLQTKEKGSGNMYTPAVRELCYSLLADQIPPAKVATTIQAVLICFMPSLDLHTIKLPSEGCASYMRRQELTTISMVHKATKITEEAQ